MSFAWYLILAGMLFVIGTTTVLMRRSATIALMGIEMMFSTAGLVLVMSAYVNSNVGGEITTFLIMVVAATGVVVGLSTVVSIYRSRLTMSMDDLNLLKN